MPSAGEIQVQRIARVSRVVRNLALSATFYTDCLGFRRIAREPCDPATLAALGLAGSSAQQIVLRLGADEIALVQFDAPGNPYPPASRSDDLWFQHLAIAVADMDIAYASLSVCESWTAISIDGPQTLPPANGGVRAFKFRDPDLHPLELIWFPQGQGRAVWSPPAQEPLFLGIDHSALAVSSRPESLAFYGALGFTADSHSLNQGPAQDRLDGLAAARVHVSGLRPKSADGPGLELLAYEPPGRSAGATMPNDILTDWVTLATPPSTDAPRAIRDPDGHLLLIAPQSSG